MVIWKHFLIHCWLFFCTVVCSFYNDFCCPSTLEWVIRGRWYCMNYTNLNREYSCLYNDITKVFDESCRFEAHRLDRGEEYVLKHNPTGVECKDKSRYQPFGFHRFQSGCVFQRTQCSESGQVVYHKGSSKVDATCRCNFKEGYSFIKIPKAVCSCTPSEEDCSCYLKVCPPDYELTADYKCVHKNNKSYFPSCPEMFQIGVDNKNKHNQQEISKQLEIEGQDKLTFHIGITLLFLMMLVLSVTLVTRERILSSCCRHLSSPRNLKVLQEREKLKISWSKGENKHSSKTKYKVYVTYSDTWENEKTQSKIADAGKLHCYLSSIFLPSKTYRIKVATCVNNKESETCAEVTIETGLPKKPQDIRTLHVEGNILLQWTPPEVSLFDIDQYKIQYTTTKDTWTHPPEYVSANSVEYVLKNAIDHKIYCFTMCACSHGVEGEEAVTSYPTYHAYQANMDFLLPTHNGLERDIKEYLHKRVSEELKSFPGQQIPIDICIRFGSVIVVCTFISIDFHDESVMRQNLERAFGKCNIGQLTISLRKFTFIALNDAEPPQCVKAQNMGHNKVAVMWTKPKKTFFKTERFILEYTMDNWVTVQTKFVSPNDTSYCISNVLPEITVQFRIYSEICHKIRSVASDVADTSVEGPSPPQNVKAIIKGTSIELSWTAPLHPIMDFVEHFRIKIEENDKTSYATVEKDELLYILPYCRSSAIYRFDVSTCTTNNKFSEASQLLEIETKDMDPKLLDKKFWHAQEHLEEDYFELNNKFDLANDARIKDITQMPNGLLVIVVYNTQLLITYEMNGKGKKTVALNQFPCNIAVVDDTTVVVSLLSRPLYRTGRVNVSVVDIKTGHVVRTIGPLKSRDTDSFPIIYANNKLFIHSSYGEISVIDLVGTKKKTIMLKDNMAILNSMCYDFKTDTIYGTTFGASKIIRINRDGTCKSVFDFSNHDVAIPRNLCVDNKRGVFVTCQRKTQRDSKYHVYRIIPGGKSFRELISLPKALSPCISYHLPSNTIIIACGPTISVYKTTDGK